MIKYEVPARLHITLYDMNGNLGRMNGGLGFLIDNPKLIFYVEKSKNIEVCYKCREIENQKKYILEEIKQLKQLYDLEGINIIIESYIPEHKGFGSKTITKLSIAKAYLDLYNKKVNIEELALILKRGGTSGISVNALEKGGFVFDGGRKKKNKTDFKPSSFQTEIEIPPILFQKDMMDIPIYLLIPNIEGIYNKKETEFFNRVCPIKERSVEKLARIINSQILPAVCEKDLTVFCEGINKIQHLEWKKSEINIYPSMFRKLIYKLQKMGYGCGMSSIGPTIYVIGENFDKLQDEIKNTKIEFEKIILTTTNNYGIKRIELNDFSDNR